jgi:hypothetical protein
MDEKYHEKTWKYDGNFAQVDQVNLGRDLKQ